LDCCACIDQSSGGFDWDQEALLPEARGEAVALRALREALRRAVGLEGARQGVRHARVSLRLRHPLLQVQLATKLLRSRLISISSHESRGCHRHQFS